jgi:Ca2+-binding EF-hand superfamily protein
MGNEQLANFINSCTNENCKAEEARVKQTMVKYDDDHDGFMTEENFLTFYYQACKDRKDTVWSNLQAHHYRKDLQKYD